MNMTSAGDYEERHMPARQRPEPPAPKDDE